MSGKKIIRKVTIEKNYSRLVYKSKIVVEKNTKSVIDDIVSSSVRNNSKLNIGGVLIWNQCQGSILQILEGPVENINNMFNKIKKDVRHSDIFIVACEDILKEQILYPVWSLTVGTDPNVSTDISDYQILSIIGTGGFATVVKAICKNSRTFAAIKIISKKRLSNNDYNIALRERYIWKELNDSKFINRLYSCLQDPLNVYFVMDFASRGDMFSCVQSYTLSYDVCVFYFCEILCGLNTIHTNNIIFGDLKLENILIDTDGHILLTDFGISRKKNETDKKIRGTPLYFAPEIINEGLINIKSDIWALGIVLYEMTGCKVPWQGLDSEIMFKLILTTHLTTNMRIDNVLNEIIQRLLIKDHCERPNCGDIIAFLSSEAIIDNWDAIQSRSLVPPHLPDFVNESSNVMLNFQL